LFSFVLFSEGVASVMFFCMETIQEAINITEAEKSNTEEGKIGERRKYRLCKTYDHRLPIRVTSKERDILKLGAEERGLSVSRYVAILVTGACLPSRQEERKALDDLLILLRRVSSNLGSVSNTLLQVSSNLERVRWLGSAEIVGEGRAMTQEIRTMVKEVGLVSREAREAIRLIFQKITY
jgi:hypothetical protein